MPDAKADRLPATLADYELFVAVQDGDTRRELVAGATVAMTNPTEPHEQIVGNIFAPLKLAVDQSAFRSGGIA